MITVHNNECAIQYESDFPYHQTGGKNYFHKYFYLLFLNRDKSKNHQVNCNPLRKTLIRLSTYIELRVFYRWKLVSGSHFKC